jgi:type IV pilus assembly protein PilM
VADAFFVTGDLMFFSRKRLGLEIGQEGAKIVLLERRKDQLRLEASGTATFPDETIKMSLKELNVLNPAAFVTKIREMYLRLLTKSEQVAVSLPDSIGRVMLVDLETRFKNKDEGANIIRWKLKKNFPFDINEAHLDYQVLLEKESGEITALVSLISRQVLRQYEDLLLEAGLQPKQIDFTTFNLYSLFARRLELAENAAVLVGYGESVSILIFSGGVLSFYRAKEIPGGMKEANRVYREINSSLLVYNDKYPLNVINEVFYICPPRETETFSSVVTEAMGKEAVLLDVSRVIEGADTAGKETLYSLAAALGAAARGH